jgi:hypothetical protein
MADISTHVGITRKGDRNLVGQEVSDWTAGFGEFNVTVWERRLWLWPSWDSDRRCDTLSIELEAVRCLVLFLGMLFTFPSEEHIAYCMFG